LVCTNISSRRSPALHRPAPAPRRPRLVVVLALGSRCPRPANPAAYRARDTRTPRDAVAFSFHTSYIQASTRRRGSHTRPRAREHLITYRRRETRTRPRRWARNLERLASATRRPLGASAAPIAPPGPIFAVVMPLIGVSQLPHVDSCGGCGSPYLWTPLRARPRPLDARSSRVLLDAPPASREPRAGAARRPVWSSAARAARTCRTARPQPPCQAAAGVAATATPRRRWTTRRGYRQLASVVGMRARRGRESHHRESLDAAGSDRRARSSRA